MLDSSAGEHRDDPAPTLYALKICRGVAHRRRQSAKADTQDHAAADRNAECDEAEAQAVQPLPRPHILLVECIFFVCLYFGIGSSTLIKFKSKSLTSNDILSHSDSGLLLKY